MIKYTIVCSNCGKTKTFEKKYPSQYERKFCNSSCAASYSNKQTWANPAVRARRIKGMNEAMQTEEYSAKQREAWNSEERRKAAGDRARNNLENTIHKPGAYEKMCTTKRDEEHRKLARKQALKRWSDPEFKAQRIADIQELTQTPEYRAARSKSALASWEGNTERKRLISQIITELWEDPEWAKQQIQRMIAGCQRRPTKPELQLFELLSTNNYPYVYIGDGGLWIGTKNPDFIWPEERKLIEMFGSHWHDKEEVQPRTKYFIDYGFDTLIIWDYELDDTEQLLAKLKKFHQ